MSQRYAILGLLNISPMTGYMIKKNLETSMQKFWPISYGGLYPTLHKLTDEKLVIVKDLDGSRGQLIYYITESGKEEFQQWMMHGKNTIQNKDEFMLKFFLSKDLSKQERLTILKDYLYSKKQMLNEMKNIQNQKESNERHFNKGIDIILKYTLLTLQNEIMVLESIINEEEVNV